MHVIFLFFFLFHVMLVPPEIINKLWNKCQSIPLFFVLSVLPCHFTQWIPLCENMPLTRMPQIEWWQKKNRSAWWNVNILKGDHRWEENIECFMSEVSSLRYQFIIALDNRDSIIYVPFRSWESCRKSTICLNLIKVWVRPGGRWGKLRERGRVEQRAETGWLERRLLDNSGKKL